MKPPHIIGLCGHPLSGKSLAAELLGERGGYQLIDDGRPLRNMARDYLGLTEEQVTTQDGKSEYVDLVGRRWQVREILGEIGNAFEEKFGGDVIPLMSANMLRPGKRYVLSSVRRDQGLFWRKLGARIIEIRNPDALPSKYEFDRFNREAVDLTVENDFLRTCPTPIEARAAFKAALAAALGL